MPDINAAMTTATASMINAIGKTVTVGGVSITAIFDNDYQSINLDSGEIGSTGPALHCKTSDVSTAKHGTAAVVDSVNYTVNGPPEPDGTGLTVLKLRKA
jgi:hypothetical protein